MNSFQPNAARTEGRRIEKPEGPGRRISVLFARLVRPQMFSKDTALVAVLAGGPVKTTSWSHSPHSPSLEKIRVSCKLGVILVGAFVFAFLTTTFLLLMFPRIRVNEPDRVRLAAENQGLSENKTLVPITRKHHAELSRVANVSSELLH